MIWGRSRCLAVFPTPSCLLSTLRVSPSMLAVSFIPVIFMSHVIKRVKSSAFSHCFFSQHILNRFDGIRWNAAEVMMVFQSNHSVVFQSRSLRLFWLKTRLSLRWVETPHRPPDCGKYLRSETLMWHIYLPHQRGKHDPEWRVEQKVR